MRDHPAVRPVIWIHCPSLGEFEQARPLIEHINKQYDIFLTFFSPSGYEIRKKYEGAKWVYYLPFDSKKNADRLIEIVKPEKVFFTKYDFWYHFVKQLSMAGIPLFVFSAKFRKDQIFFKFYGGIFRDLLKNFSKIFVQDENSKILLNNIGVKNVYVLGDTRFDRVIKIKETRKEIHKIKDFKEQDTRKLIVLGSVWEQDMKVWIPFILSSKGAYKYVVAPHEIHQGKIGEYKDKLNAICYSENLQSSSSIDVLILDTIGLLSSAYAYADYAYIGGGFGKGIHNTLEAAVYGIPVLIGPKYSKFQEAYELIETGQMKVIADEWHIGKELESFDKISIKKSSDNYFSSKSGSVKMIVNQSFN